MAVGIVGGATKVHPTARAALKLMASRLPPPGRDHRLSRAGPEPGCFARPGNRGIQRGHMSLHARQVAVAAGAQGDMIELLARQLVQEKTVRIDRAEEILKDWNNRPSSG